MTTREIIRTIPKASEVRQELAKSIREADVLRRLLKVAEYATKQLPKEQCEDGRGNA